MPGVSKGYSLTHAYKFYKEKHGNVVDKATYRKICYAFNLSLRDDVLKGKVVKLPHKLGSLWIKKFQTNPEKPPINLYETRKKGSVVYHMNFHSDGWSARWAWSKLNKLVTNLIYYSFKPSKKNSRMVAQIMKQPDGHKRYFS